MSRLPLHVKISIYVAAGLVVIFSCLGLLGQYVVKKANAQVMDGRLAVAKLAAFYVDSELSEQYSNLAEISQTLAPVLAKGEKPGTVEIEYEPFITGTVVMDPQGGVLWSTGRGPALAAYLRNGTLLNKATGGPPRTTSGVFELAPGLPAVALVVPIRAPGGMVVGVVAKAIDPNNVAFVAYIQEASRLGASGHAELLDDQGTVIVSSEGTGSMRPGTYPELVGRVRRSGTPTVATTASWEGGRNTGIDHVVAMVPLQYGGWELALGGTAAEMQGPTRQWQILLVTGGVVSLLAALLMVWITARSVTEPVRQLTLATERIAAGDLREAAMLEADAETGQLGRSFDTIRRRLTDVLHALTVEKSQYEAVFRSMADTLFTVDAEHRIRAFNPAAERLTGLVATDVLGRKCSEVFQPDGGKSICNGCPMQSDEPVATPEDMAAIERYCTAASRSFSVATARSPILGEDGAVSGAVFVMRDLSAREELHRLQDEFISTVSHELRTPLGFVKGYATTLLRRDAEVDAKTERQFLQIIDEASDDLKGLIDALLDMSKIRARALVLEQQELALPALVRRVVAKARKGARDYQFQVAFPRNFPPVLGDPIRLEQVLTNLLSNARKYAPPGSCIEVAGRVEAREVIISVADQGMGLPPEDLELVFERFYRSREVRRRGIGGTGLGLAICRGIIGAHGGRIWAENRPGGGAIFAFALPLAEERKEADS